MPKVYDKEGRELTVGARVEHCAEGTGTLHSAQWKLGHGWLAVVKWDATDSLRWEDTLPAAEPDTYRCPDLLLIDSPAETEATKGHHED